MLGLGSLYTTDQTGKYTGLKEPSGELTAVPTCPDCRVPIRQFATRRYNRVVNKAVMDEISKRFLMAGRVKLANLDKRMTEMEDRLAKSEHMPPTWRSGQRHNTAQALRKEAINLRQDMKAEHQPTKKLFDAIITSQRDHPLGHRLQTLTLSTPDATKPINHPPIPQPIYNHQITLQAHRLALRADEAILRDTFMTLGLRAGKATTTTPSPHLLGGQSRSTATIPLPKQCADFLHQCEQLIEHAEAAALPRLVVPTVLSYARVV